MYIAHVDADPVTQGLVRRARDRVAQHADLIAVDTLRSALSILASVPVACVVTELALRDAAGAEVVRRLHGAQPDVPIVVLAANASSSCASAPGMPVGEWLAKAEADVDAVSAAIGTALGQRVLAGVAAGDAVADGPEVTRFGGQDFIACAPAMRRVLALVESAADTDVPVLLEGETGTGKEILARALHARSARRQAPLVVQNCGAVAEQLLESELFGHVRGAFTGAERDRAGLFLEAGGGTVFLDEIGEASPTVQARLLRVLQHREVKPVGSDRAQRVSARIVAATNRSLADEVRSRRFRADVYYRLAVFPIAVPALRQRAADIPRLARHFLERFSARERRAGLVFSAEALGLLSTYHWPGNVRELEHEVHRLVLTVPRDSVITPDHLAARIRHHAAPPANEPLDDMLARVEIALIRERLERFPTKADAARSLGITREGLYAKLRRLGIWSSTPS
jgi:two-component system, NtrC family, response regulator HydG